MADHQRGYGRMVLFHAIDAPISPFSLLSRKRRMGEALILEGSADTTAFEIYIEQILAPSLQAGQIVILDNLNTHTGEKVRQAIEARGCQLLFLPSYSPDLSPIEEAFSKLKAGWKRVGDVLDSGRLGSHCSYAANAFPSVVKEDILFCLSDYQHSEMLVFEFQKAYY